MCRCNRLSFVPYEVAGCVNLKILSLNHNRLTAIQGILEHLHYLTHLNISQNKLVCSHESSVTYLLTDKFFTKQMVSALPSSLVSVNLSGNELNSLPSGIESLAQLKVHNFCVHL